RRTGPSVPYWFADPKAIKAGYPVKSANLSEYAGRPAELKSRAERLQAEMLLFLKGDMVAGPQFDGTFRSLLSAYESNPESSFNTELKPRVQRSYAVYVRRLTTHIGGLRIDHCNGLDAKRWFKEWRYDPSGKDRLPRARFVLAVLKAAIS